MGVRNYTYYDLTRSLCTTCLKLIDAKVVFQDGNVYLLKHCPAHGKEKVLVATDIEYYKRCREYIKPGETPVKMDMPIKYGCPYDCGLCVDHEQHSCVSIVEVTDRCNLTCPTCYAGSSPTYGRHRTLDEIKAMLDSVVEHEGEPDIVQISGGEPTIHPDFFAILDYAVTLPIRHIMVNTNGIKISQSDEFAQRLKAYDAVGTDNTSVEIYLQFDSFRPEVLKKMRGKDLTEVRSKCLDRLNKHNIHTTLVATVEKGLNNDELGDIIAFATKQKCIRGVTFQPTQFAGRVENFDPKINKYSLTEARDDILSQSDLFKPEDIIPVPCNPDSIAMSYALKFGGKVTPLTSMLDPSVFLDTRNTILLEQDKGLQDKLVKVFSTSQSGDGLASSVHSLLCCLPKIVAPKLGYENIFRVIILQFMDAYDFDVRSVKKSCVHIVNKDNKMIPFETMNLFYRDDKIERLKSIQNSIIPESR